MSISVVSTSITMNFSLNVDTWQIVMFVHKNMKIIVYLGEATLMDRICNLYFSCFLQYAVVVKAVLFFLLKLKAVFFLLTQAESS